MIYEKELSDKIIGCAFEVYNTLGNCFLEKVYEHALMVEFEINKIDVVNQAPLKVYYKNHIVGNYFADILVQDKIILELKVVNHLENIHKAQLLNYLQASKIKIGYLLNFGHLERLEFQRLVY